MSYAATSWRRWLAWLLVAVAFAIACVFLSNWQFNRRAEVVAKNDLVTRNYDQAPLPVEQVLGATGFERSVEWRPVTLAGHYVPGTELLVRNKPYGGNQGFLQVAMFEHSDGKLYLVDRGWLPTGSTNETPDSIPPLPTGELRLEARIRAAETVVGKTVTEGLLPYVNPTMAAAETEIRGVFETTAYLRLSSEKTSGGQTLDLATRPMSEAKPLLSEGNHLSYAIQWIMFAIMAFATLGYFVRTERRHYLAATDPNYVIKPKRVRRSELDERVEDELAR